jgi:hypothetical protein
MTGEVNRHNSRYLLILFIGWILSTVIAVSVPALYFTVARYGMKKALLIETSYIAKRVELSIQVRPDLWEFETIRLLETLSQPSSANLPEQRDLSNASGEILVKTEYRADRPLVDATVEVFDSGQQSEQFALN